MERQVNYTVIGIIFCAVLLGMIAFIFWIGRMGFSQDKYSTYNIYTNENISGITKNTEVRFKGLSIGFVQNIGFNEDGNIDEDAKNIKIVVKIIKDMPLREGDGFEIDSNGLAGLNFLSLKPNESGAYITNVEEDKTLKILPSKLGQIISKADVIAEKVDSMITNLNDVVVGVKGVLSKDNVENFHDTLQNIRNFSYSLNKTKNILNTAGIKVSNMIDGINVSIKNVDLFLMQTQNSMQVIDQFLYKGQMFLNKLNEDPYNAIFGTDDAK